MNHDSTNRRPPACADTYAADEISQAIGHMSSLISPDNEMPLESRLEQLALTGLGQVITAQQKLLAIQQTHISLLTAQTTNQQMALERIQTDVGRLMACVDMRPHLIGGRLPALSEITQLRVQIFHTPDLCTSERKAKTEWSLRLTVWVNGVRAAEEIKGVPLYPGRDFAQKVTNLRGNVPDWTKSLAEQAADRDGDDLLMGMLRAITRGKGTPYIPDQVCLLRDRRSDAPFVGIAIGGEEVLEFRNFRPAAGTKSGRAKLWDEWVR